MMHNDDYVPDYVTCEGCNGLGENPIEGTCLTCGGTGAVPNTEEKTVAELEKEHIEELREAVE